MNPHERNARILAQENSPTGHLCRGLLELLDTAREDSIWAQACAEYLQERVTLGGVPVLERQPITVDPRTGVATPWVDPWVAP